MTPEIIAQYTIVGLLIYGAILVILWSLIEGVSYLVRKVQQFARWLDEE